MLDRVSRPAPLPIVALVVLVGAVAGGGLPLLAPSAAGDGGAEGDPLAPLLWRMGSFRAAARAEAADAVLALGDRGRLALARLAFLPTPERAAQAQALVAELASPSWERREAASRSLEAMGADAIPALEAAGGHADAEVRARARRLSIILERAGVRAAAVRRRAAALDALARDEPVAILEPTTALLVSGDAPVAVRAAALRALLADRTPGADRRRVIVEKACADGDPGVRALAALAVARWSTPPRGPELARVARAAHRSDSSSVAAPLATARLARAAARSDGAWMLAPAPTASGEVERAPAGPPPRPAVDRIVRVVESDGRIGRLRAPRIVAAGALLARTLDGRPVVLPLEEVSFVGPVEVTDLEGASARTVLVVRLAPREAASVLDGSLERWEPGVSLVNDAAVARTYARGALITVSGVGLVEVDLRGRAQRTLAVDAYDGKRIAGGGILYTDRTAGRVVELDAAGAVVREASGLNGPTDAERLADGTFVVLENGQGRVVAIDPSGTTRVLASGLSNPYDVDVLPDGHLLIADAGADRIVELDATGKEVWQVTGLSFPNSVDRLLDGRTAFTTYRNGELVVVEPDGTIASTHAVGGTLFFCRGLVDGRIAVGDGAGGRIVIVDPATGDTEERSTGQAFVDCSPF